MQPFSSIQLRLEQIRQAQKHFRNFEKKFEEVGKGLQKAQDAYHTATTHLSHFSNNRVVGLTGETMSELGEGEPEPPAAPGAG